ncbi:MAG: PKD domain-containing protein, partial [Microthrixaceae bacterium]
MNRARRAIPVVLFGFIALVAGACNPPVEGGGGPANAAPTASATADVTSGNVPLTVNFDGSASTDPEGQPLTYDWDFGNGATGSGAVVSTTYTAGGTFNAVLTVTDNLGMTDTATVTITANGDGDGDGYFPPADCNDGDASINPGAPDAAGDGIDSNCDGIDGTVNAVFVSNSGTDSGTCGVIASPCATIAQGITRTSAIGTTEVYVAGGTYSKFNAVNGVDVIGGYGQNWQRGLTATGSTTVTVNSAFDASVGGPVALVASGITSATRIADLTLKGGNAAAGQTSYTVYVNNSTSALQLDSLKVIGGTGGQGASGAAGTGGWTGPANSGGTGANGFEPGGLCNTSSAGAGGGGASGPSNGGAGGKGGVVDGSCGWTGFCSNCDAQTGNSGTKGSGAAGGNGGAGGPANNSSTPFFCDGGAGQELLKGANGSPGAAGSAGSAGSGGNPGANGGTGGLGV